MTSSWKILPAPVQPGQVGGHEGVGTVVKLGPGTENGHIKLGQRVGIKWISGTCGSCRKFALLCSALPMCGRNGKSQG